MGLGKRLDSPLLAVLLLLAGTVAVFLLLSVLKHRQAGLQAGLDDLPDAIFLVDRAGLIRQWNRAAEELVGDRLFHSGQAFTEIAVLDSQATLSEALSRSFLDGDVSFETRLSSAEGIALACQGKSRLLSGARGLMVSLRLLPASIRREGRTESFRQIVELLPSLAAVVAEGRIL